MGDVNVVGTEDAVRAALAEQAREDDFKMKGVLPGGSSCDGVRP
jgi:hypothetical protein